MGVLAQGGNPHPPAGVVEEDVAGVGDGLGDGLQPVGLSLLAVEPALGLGAVVVGVPAGVQNLGLRGEVPLLQGRRGGDQLEGGPRGVEPLDRPVHQGVGLVGGQGRVVGGEGGLVIPRLAHHGQHPAVVHVQGHQGPAGGLGVAVQEGPQGLLRRGLQVPVQGEGDVPPRLGFLGIGGGGDPAGLVGLHHPLAGGAVEIGFKGGLRPVLAHQGIHGVALGPIGFPLLGAHLAHPAQDVGGQRPLPHPLGHRGEGDP